MILTLFPLSPLTIRRVVNSGGFEGEILHPNRKIRVGTGEEIFIGHEIILLNVDFPHGVAGVFGESGKTLRPIAEPHAFTEGTHDRAKKLRARKVIFHLSAQIRDFSVERCRYLRRRSNWHGTCTYAFCQGILSAEDGNTVLLSYLTYSLSG